MIKLSTWASISIIRITKEVKGYTIGVATAIASTCKMLIVSKDCAYRREPIIWPRNAPLTGRKSCPIESFPLPFAKIQTILFCDIPGLLHQPDFIYGIIFISGSYKSYQFGSIRCYAYAFVLNVALNTSKRAAYLRIA